jgi:precorrin-4 C11-methyltransferase
MIHFVGAGPGAPDLITIRGRQYLRDADVIIYAGSLVNPELLKEAKPSARIFNSAVMSLDEVEAVILEAENEGLTTVRLHTGDTSVYSTIREQIDTLSGKGISYDVTPGVSAFQAAAAALHAELTLPGITQSVILTRAEGRTKVPEGEELKTFAAHKATMALYLSASLAERVSGELISGGYAPDTPVAVVYKASWPEERVLRTDLTHLAERMQAEDIRKTAVILVGDVLGAELLPAAAHEKKRAYEPSRLYDPAFTTGYRQAKHKNICLVACTIKGAEAMKRLEETWKQQEPSASFELCVKCAAHPENDPRRLKEIIAGWFDSADVIVFFASTGIAVRAIAPYVKSKVTDPAILVVDEGSHYCIPLLSGHLGGANAYAKTVSGILKTQTILTTATDVEKRFAVDVFARENGLRIADMALAKEIAAASVRKEELKFWSEWPVEGRVPDGVILVPDRKAARIVVGKVVAGKEWAVEEATVDNAAGKPDDTAGYAAVKAVTVENAIVDSAAGKPDDAVGYAAVKAVTVENAIVDSKAGEAATGEDTAEQLILEPVNVSIGIGCRKGIPKEKITSAVELFLQENNLSPSSIERFASIDLKAEEEGLLQFVREWKDGHPELVFFSPEELRTAEGTFSESEFVQSVTGVSNVCERSAVLASGGRLIAPKRIYEGVTVAAAERKIRLRWGESGGSEEPHLRDQK